MQAKDNHKMEQSQLREYAFAPDLGMKALKIAEKTIRYGIINNQNIFNGRTINDKRSKPMGI